jgi:general secretion pathway protein D
MGGGFGGPRGGGVAPAEPRSKHEEDADSLIDLITTNVNPESWDEVGGPGSISAYNGLIVVTQTPEIHKKIERVLDMLREAAGLEVGGTKKVVRYVP